MNTMFDLSGQWALVFGGSRGLGRTIALGLAQAGANIVLSATKEEKLNMVASEVEALGSKAIVKVCDVTDLNAVQNLFQELDAEINDLDILVNSAGIIRISSPPEEFSLEDWDDVIEVNLRGTFITCREAGKRMVKRGKGKIINLASVVSFRGAATIPSYVVSKGGIAQLTRALSNEWASKGINVNALAPGYFKTALTVDLHTDPTRYNAILNRIPAARWGNEEDLKSPAIFLASPASDYVNGHMLVVDGGWMNR